MGICLKVGSTLDLLMVDLVDKQKINRIGSLSRMDWWLKKKQNTPYIAEASSVQKWNETSFPYFYSVCYLLKTLYYREATHKLSLVGTRVLGYLRTGTSVGGFPMLVVTWYLALVLSAACPACKLLGYAENEIGRTLSITINGADVELTLAVAGSNFFFSCKDSRTWC